MWECRDMHTKIFATDDLADSLLQEVGSPVRLINTSSQVKEASGSSVISKADMLQYAPDRDHFACHVIALGDEEHFLKNKNNDGWPGADLEKRSGTFVTHGAYYREHRNRKKSENIGSIKLARYSPKMGRTELIYWGRLKPDADSQLTAEPEYERIKAGKEVDVSMSARVPHDVCSICKHKAKSPAEYCTHAKNQLGQWLPEHNKFAYVSNPGPTFFDISSVANRADRIARYISFRHPEGVEHSKAASLKDAVSGSDWAEMEGLILPCENLHYADLGRIAMLRKLANAERFLLAQSAKSASLGRSEKLQLSTALSGAACSDWSDEDIKSARLVSVGRLMRKLASRKAFMPPATFMSYVTGDSLEHVRKDACCVRAMEMGKGIFSDLEQNGFSGIDASGLDVCSPGGEYSSNRGDPIDDLMDVAEDKFSLEGNKASERLIQITITVGLPAKSASVGSSVVLPDNLEKAARILAETYAAYKVAGLRHIAQVHGSEHPTNYMITTVVGQNWTA